MDVVKTGRVTPAMASLCENARVDPHPDEPLGKLDHPVAGARGSVSGIESKSSICPTYSHRAASESDRVAAFRHRL